MPYTSFAAIEEALDKWRIPFRDEPLNVQDLRDSASLLFAERIKNKATPSAQDLEQERRCLMKLAGKIGKIDSTYAFDKSQLTRSIQRRTQKVKQEVDKFFKDKSFGQRKGYYLDGSRAPLVGNEQNPANSAGQAVTDRAELARIKGEIARLKTVLFVEMSSKIGKKETPEEYARRCDAYALELAALDQLAKELEESEASQSVAGLQAREEQETWSATVSKVLANPKQELLAQAKAHPYAALAVGGALVFGGGYAAIAFKYEIGSFLLNYVVTPVITSGVISRLTTGRWNPLKRVTG